MGSTRIMSKMETSMELKAFSDLFLVYNQIILRIKNVKDMYNFSIREFS